MWELETRRKKMHTNHISEEKMMTLENSSHRWSSLSVLNSTDLFLPHCKRIVHYHHNTCHEFSHDSTQILPFNRLLLTQQFDFYHSMENEKSKMYPMEKMIKCSRMEKFESYSNIWCFLPALSSCLIGPSQQPTRDVPPLGILWVVCWCSCFTTTITTKDTTWQIFDV